ncbi:DUF6873 family GME fold protein [Defluviitalea phaphyphila]|uniref:DUF6873 family GME fold protein n=1 Tax=Defluviitalea phaphyphila TaxID=1473580 RepID=UPI0007307483|nr:hypothetical protein [Defluviitalea phaphyphila]
MIFISQNASDNIKNTLNKVGKIIEIRPINVVYESINHHPDIFLFKGDKKIYIAKEQYECIKYELEDNTLQIEVLENQLGYNYPNTVAFNAVNLGKYFIHNLKYTSPIILEDMKKLNKKLIHVKQGYTRCSALPIDDNSIITSDVGIAKTVFKYKIDVCLIKPGFILLPGQKYGFIGGCGGRIKNKIYFSGDITRHPDYEKMKRFIQQRDLEIIYDTSTNLIDIGSIL